MLERWRLLVGPPVGAAVVILLLLVPNTILTEPVGGDANLSADVPTQAAFNTHIDHIVIMMMENHAFDNYYGVYCLKRTAYCSMKNIGLPPGICIPKNLTNASKGCVKPFPLGLHNLTIHEPMPHSWNSTHADWNNGSMNGFYQGEGSGVYPFGYYTGTTAPIMWDLAEEYGLGDMFFSSIMSDSLPNHWHLIAGQAPAEIQAHNFQTGPTAYTANRTIYLNEANATETVEDLFLNASVSWKWYDHPIAPNYTAAIGSLNPNGARGTALLLWNPMAAKAESYNSTFRSHFVSNTQFFADAASGHLPDVSYVIPPGNSSDHPPYSTARAQDWIASVVDAVESSPDWNHTALFITYDEAGGFYDSVAPPMAVGTNETLGFRVPLLVISPYARENYISDQTDYFESLLRLVEDRFHMPCLTVVDCNAPSLLQYFNFNQAPRVPIIFSTSIYNKTFAYPIPLQNATNFNTYPTQPWSPALDITFYPNGEGPDID